MLFYNMLMSVLHVMVNYKQYQQQLAVALYSSLRHFQHEYSV